MTDLLDLIEAGVRASDPDTSAKAATNPASIVRFGTQRRRLLEAYEDGIVRLFLSDEEAAERAGLLRTGFWKRCSELRAAGLIVRTGTKEGSCGTEVMVCRITVLGHDVLRDGGDQ